MKIVRSIPYENDVYEKLHQKIHRQIEEMHISAVLRRMEEIISFEKLRTKNSQINICVDVHSLIHFFHQAHKMLCNIKGVFAEVDPTQWKIFKFYTMSISNILINLQKVLLASRMVLLIPNSKPIFEVKSSHLLKQLMQFHSPFEPPYKKLEMLQNIQQEVVRLVEQLKQKQSCIEIKMIPWLDKEFLRENPCATQLAYYAQKKYLCLSWNPMCLRLIPKGSYIICLNVFELNRIHATHQIQSKFLDLQFVKAELFDLCQQRHKEVLRGQYNEETWKREQADLNQKLAIEYDDMSKQISMREYFCQGNSAIYYNMNKFLAFAEDSKNSLTNQYSCIPCVTFETDQIYIMVVGSLYRTFYLSSDILKAIREGTYDCAKWILQKIVAIYLLYQLHPIITIDNEVQSRKQFVSNKISVVKEWEIKYGEQNQTIFEHSSTAIFIHRQFEQTLNSFIPVHRQRNLIESTSQKAEIQQNSTTACTHKHNERNISLEVVRGVSSNLFMVNTKNVCKNNNYIRRASAWNKIPREISNYNSFNSFESDIESESKMVLRIGNPKCWESQ